ncbi:hypothetical protein VOLCADRAFT_120244 [Volvox carteri f. nagariensis]|uniref:Uncharacterized protein n=1 Tax=Volvox carteri f. nagariensis TaxID=3068 RepID=D8TIN3_VOLCA|nr:uncharacterized protein VOLCADRAFT_120244 [Volvox carteri f. nagariensis]EFJ53274.1 hypothetical protein VOLCADRAFT_120244 [Volvox carteri f. nagariensis]|eukprot:XP_002946279.1 hypothetical protein VOLCADRAFT_120244 [Volvox carteri f. nagariensis]
MNAMDYRGFRMQVFGPARFFASHAWTYKFGALVSMLDNHYCQLPGTKGGAKFIPWFYWVDILAVTQHFTGDIKDHPDYDFAATSPSYSDITQLQRHHPATATPPSYSYTTQLQRHHPATATPPSYSDITQLQLHHPATATSPSYSYTTQLQRHHPATATSPSYSYITQLQLHHPATATPPSYSYITQLQLHHPATATSPSYSYITQLQRHHPATTTPPSYSDITQLQRHHPATATPPSYSDITQLQLHHPATATSPSYSYITQLQLHHPATATSPSYSYITQLQLHHPATATSPSYSDITQLQLHHPATATSPSYSDITQLQLHHPATATSPSYSYTTQLQRHHPATATSPSYSYITQLQLHHPATATSLSFSCSHKDLLSAPIQPTNHPTNRNDSTGVIKQCKAVLFTMHPWRSPIAPTRVWCLFEALTAIQAPGVEFEVVVDVKDSKDTRVQTVQIISNSIEVRTAQATVSADKAFIIECIEKGIGITAFNNTIRKRLKEALLQAVTPNAVEMGDTPALHELLKIGGCVRPDGISDLAAYFKFASETDMLNIMRTIQIRDLRPRGLALSGRQRTKEVALADAGLRGWDGESCSLREYTETETGRTLWSYLPASPALCHMLNSALQATRTLEALQIVKCTAPSSGDSAATAKLNAELFAMGLGCGNLRHLHVRPGDLLYMESFPASALARASSSFLLRRVTLAPVALGPTAIRQLGKALAPQPYLHSLLVGMDPAPPATWMPREQTEWDQWLAHEDRSEPDMAERRRKHLGLAEDDQAAYLANAWDFKDELSALPDPDRGYIAVQQRAACISFFVTMSAGWRDVATYCRQYGKWNWARRTQPEEQLVCGGAAPETYSSKFDPNEQKRRSAKSRLQKAFWETFI